MEQNSMICLLHAWSVLVKMEMLTVVESNVMDENVHILYQGNVVLNVVEIVCLTVGNIVMVLGLNTDVKSVPVQKAV